MRNILIILLFTLGCDNTKEQDETGEFISEDIDTIALVASLNIIEEKIDFDSLYDNLDTIIVGYQSFACDCPQWELEKSGDYFYIEPSTINLETPWQIEVKGNKVKLIGKEYKGLGYPNNAKFIDGNPPKGKVFKYFGYEILKPYKVWAGRRFDHINPISEDSIFVATQYVVE